MKRHGVISFLLILILMQFGVNSCNSSVQTPLAPTQIVIATATASPSATPTPIKFNTETPVPSPTPRTYTIQSNDTIIGIAKKLDLTPEAILMANPGINASALIIGSSINLPSDQDDPDKIFIAPAPLKIHQPICFIQLDLLRCAASVINESDAVVENISVDLYLIGVNGEELGKISVPTLLNALYPGETQPAIGTFDLPEQFNSVQAVLTSAFVAPDPQFSRDHDGVTTTTSISWDGRSAMVAGSMTPVDGKNVWVAALGFDEDGVLCATRRWEWNADPQPVSEQFTIDLVSFGGQIEKVDVLVESWSD